MKKLSVIFFLIWISVSAYAVLDGSQWIYTGTSPAGTGRAYTGVADMSSAGNFLYNPAAVADIRRLTVFGDFGFGSPDFLLNAGASIPLPNGILSVAGNVLGSSRNVGALTSVKVGFSKTIIDGFAFGFDGYLGYQVSGASSDLAIGLDIGTIFTINDLLPYTQGFGIKNNRIGIVLTGLGKPSILSNADPVPGMGLRGGLNGTWMDFGFIKGLGNVDLTLHLWPFNIFANAGVTFNIVEHFNLRTGLILGNNGIGSFSSNALSVFTLGASFNYQISEIPFEIYYSFNPVTVNGSFNANHFIGVEIGFGSLDTAGPKTELAYKGSTNETIYFSPNYDGSQDTVPVNLTIQDDSIVEDYTLKIFDSKGTLVKQFKGVENRDVSLDLGVFWKKLWAKKEAVQVPQTIEWNGTSDSGAILPEGAYTIILESKDQYKNAGSSKTNTMFLDITPPQANVGVSDMIFSPVTNSRKNSITFMQKLGSGDFWKAEIRDVNGNAVRNWDWNTNPPASLVWDGKDNNGALLPDGVYDYIIYGSDLAGNRSIFPIKGIVLTTKKTSVFLTLDKTSFSPNGDTADDTVKISPVVPETNGIESWSLTVQDSSNNTVKVFKGQASVPPALIWDGKDNNNKKVPDGQYRMQLNVDYQSGINTESQVYPVTLDTSAPAVELTTEPELFSPDGDGEDDTLFMHLKINDPQGVKRWKMTIYDPDKKPFKTFEGNGEPAETIQWDGRSEKGELVESAQNYKVKVYSEDNIGNRSDKEVYTVKVDVLVEKTDRGLKIRINNIEFEFGKANLQSASTPILNRVSQLLRKYGNYKVEIQGHTDNIGTEQYNLDLSKRRAEAVYGYLLKKGLAADRMTTVGLGFQYPYADNATEEGRRKNRRVEFILIKNQ